MSKLTTLGTTEEPRRDFQNAIFLFENIEYLVHVLSSDDKSGESLVEIMGFCRPTVPIRRPRKKLALLPLGATCDVRTVDLQIVHKLFPVLTLQKFAAHNAMLFTKAEELIFAAEWTPLMSVEPPKILDPGDSPRFA